MLKKLFGLLFLSPLLMGVSFSQECVDPYVDNATFVVSQQAASNSFEGGETIKATAVSSNICVGKGETKRCMITSLIQKAESGLLSSCIRY